jgi:uncharacterized phage protein gp47/JayE
MPLERPTLKEIETRIRADLKAHLPESDPELRRGNLQVLSRVEAAAVHGLYGLAESIALQLMVDTAEAEYLERHAGIWAVYRKPASKAGGQLLITGANGHGLGVGAEFKRADDVRVVSRAEAVIADGEALVDVEAVETGADGNAEVNTGFTLISYANGINPTAKAAAGGLTGGADAETDAALRARLLKRIQQPPEGGSENDYVAWALQLPGVTRAFAYPNRTGPGTVGLTFLMDDAESGPIPAAQDLADMADHIEALRPVTAFVQVFACVAVPVAFEIELRTKDTAQIREAVTGSLEDLFRYESEPEGGLLISHIREAISTAAGEFDHALISPTTDLTAGAGELLTLGAITWS